jgi:hypothetical protein
MFYVSLTITTHEVLMGVCTSASCHLRNMRPVLNLNPDPENAIIRTS